MTLGKADMGGRFQGWQLRSCANADSIVVCPGEDKLEERIVTLK
jgi:hypothetical protein